MNKSWSVGDVYSEAWNLYMNNFGVCLGATVVAMLLAGAAGPFLVGPMYAGLFIFMFRLYRGEEARFDMIFEGFSLFVPTLVAVLIMMVFSTIGFMLCIIPGIIITILYTMALPLIADKKMEAWPALETSRKAVMDNFGAWFLIFLFNALLGVLGLCLCIIGAYLIAPLLFLAIAIAYDKTIQGVPIEVFTEL